jgi:hypothetical protein
VHSVFHLDRPSATIVVRTYSDPGAQPQFKYAPPGVAVDPFFRDAVAVRRIQSLDYLRQLNRARYLSAAREAIARSDLHTAYLILEDATRALGRRAGLTPLVGALAARHGNDAATVVAAAMEHQLRQTRIVEMRAEVMDPELRFFLALLLNLPDRDAILAVIAQRHPAGDPRARVDKWLRRLSGVELLGVDLGDELTLSLVRALMAGRDGPALYDWLEQEFDPNDVSAQRAGIASHCDRLRGSLLAPLFVASA